MSERARARGNGEQVPWPAIIALTVAAILATAVVAAIASFNSTVGQSRPLPPPPGPSAYGTRREIGTSGDAGNPRALFHGAFPSDADTQERTIGGLPARFSGYTTWVRSVAGAPAHSLVDAYRGNYLRAHVTVFNRDTEDQQVCSCDFYVWTRAAGLREADAVGTPTLATDTTMRSGARLDGDVYLYVGHVPGPYYIVFNPDAHVSDATSKARGVWRARADATPVSGDVQRTTRSAPPPTPS